MTFHRLANYGAALQAYALNKKIKDLGYDSEIIDFRFNIKENRYLPFCPSLIKTPRNIISTVLYYSLKKKRKKIFDKFIEETTSLSSLCRTDVDLETISKKYKRIICGSDQVWSYTDGGIQEEYFLQFADKKKRYAYAASFGVNSIPSNLREKYATLLKDFVKITVREDVAVALLSEIAGIDAIQVLDPTLLLTKKEWIEDMNLNHEMDGNYVLIYTLQKNKTIYEFTKKLAAEKKLEVINVTSSYKDCYSGIKNIRYASPEQFVELFSNAKYVVTNSFHGIAFSLNFNKTFFPFSVSKPVLTNSRIMSVLKLFGLEDNIDNTDMNLLYNWDDINEKIKLYREKSIHELKKICGN